MMDDEMMGVVGSEVSSTERTTLPTTDHAAPVSEPPISEKETLQRMLSSRFFYWAMSALLGIAALYYNFYRIGVPSIWFDEAFSVELASQPLPRLWQIIFGPEPNMELYYLFLHYWLDLTHFLGWLPTEAVVRAPSAVFSAMSTLVVFAIGRRFLGPVIGAVVAALYLLNDLQLVYAQQTRSYALQLFLTCLAWYALLTVFNEEEHNKRWWAIYIIANVLAVYTHLLSLLVLFTQVIAIAGLLLVPNPWREQVRKRFTAIVISLISISVLIIPMLIESRQGAKTGWLDVPHLTELESVFIFIGGGSKRYVFVYLLCVVFGLYLIFLNYLMQISHMERSSSRPLRVINVKMNPLQKYVPFAWSMFCWFAVSLLVAFVVSQGTLRIFSTRYMVIIIPPLFLLVGLCVAAIPWNAVKLFPILILLGFAFHLTPIYYASAQVEDWNSTTGWMQVRYQIGDGLVCYDSATLQGCQIAVEYYLHAYPSGAHFSTDSPGAFSWANFGAANPQAGFDAATDPASLSAYASKHKRIFYIIGRLPDPAAGNHVKIAVDWLDQHEHFVDQVATNTVIIRLYNVQ